ncbi:MAG TPA: DUF3553 domain-containing protein [Alphaproteobacteria bacterium]|jgi:hypothetical protein|nr:DUF3553 domain-containing protein [Alphaproteobacteria bacterium]
MSDILTPGTYVRHPTQPDWGLGQVQSVIGNRVTVNFENAGKLLINSDVIELITVDIAAEQK